VTARPEPERDGEDAARLEELLALAMNAANRRRGWGPTAGSAAREPLSAACAFARAKTIRPEEVLVHLKRVWSNIADSEFLTRHDAQHVLDGMVSECIEQYFADCSGK